MTGSTETNQTASESQSNVAARETLTLQWLLSTDELAIPVYQREYRWSVGTCDRLLSDIRAVSSAPDGRTHFIGSLLATQDLSKSVTLVDGQQRVTTLMLILGAIHDLARKVGSTVADDVRSVIFVPGSGGGSRTRLRPHERYAGEFEGLMAGQGPGSGASSFAENFEYIVDAIADDWEDIWAGLSRIEHVVITLGERSNAQQVFESLNSTGEALSDDELIHNYIHMGRPLAEQVALEKATWEPIETATGGAIRSFWRDYMVFTGETQPNMRGEFGVYRAFRARYPEPQRDIGEQLQEQWRRLSIAYGVVVSPSKEADVELAEALQRLHTFESAPRPFVMGLYDAYRAKAMDRGALLGLLARLETMLLRRAQVDMPRGLEMIGTMCREFARDVDPAESIDKRTPEDPAISRALIHIRPAHVVHILSELQRTSEIAGPLQIEHIYPQTPTSGWSGDGGMTTWGNLAIEEQAEYRAHLNTLGNLTLLEAGLNASASNRSFQEKAAAYSKSEVEETRGLAGVNAWDIDSIRERTERLSKAFLEAWPKRGENPLDEPDDRVKVVDLVIPNLRSDPPIIEYATFKDELWGDVHTVRDLHRRVAETLWELDPERFRAAPNGNQVSTVKVPRTHTKMRDGNWLYNRWWPFYLLAAARVWIQAFDLQDEFYVKLLPGAEETDAE